MTIYNFTCGCVLDWSAIQNDQAETHLNAKLYIKKAL
jgi:hypothetical protein